ncbi:hypothetical protein [Kribbella sp. VKM Ac-2568]|uniref:hypothetical protein n=1 Tax=Kribbella sp. VKM Ac-2568 TaxID=2512219 RepID=UPI0010514A78|nr:hypothetical protein [Kribbella sp. VKM Ac-2568]
MRTEQPELTWWVSAVMGGVLFGVVMGAFTKLDGSSWTAAGVGALVTGVPFGLVAGWWSARWQRGMKDAEGGLPADKVRLAHRAVMGGAVPKDEEVRSAALRIASTYLADYTGRTRRLSILVMVFLLIGTVTGAVSESPWALLGALVPAVLLYTQWYWPRRLRRRIRSLTPAPTETTQ